MPLEITIRFAKLGIMRFVSHLDLMRLFQRALRRAGIPVAFSEGFNPHIKLKVIPALKLGVESRDLKVIVRLKEDFENTRLKELLQNNLPIGIEILEVI